MIHLSHLPSDHAFALCAFFLDPQRGGPVPRCVVLATAGSRAALQRTQTTVAELLEAGKPAWPFWPLQEQWPSPTLPNPIITILPRVEALAREKAYHFAFALADADWCRRNGIPAATA